MIPVLGNETGRAGRVAEWAPDPGALPGLLAGAALAVIVRSGASWGIDLLAARGAVRVKAQLRSAALDALDARSPVWLAERPDAAPTTALGRGLDALDGYFSNYLPQLILTGCATPLLVLAVLLADPVSGITVLLVFPVIPVFMVLIGLATRSVQERQWAQLQRLSGAFLDAVEGLATLRIFRREQHQVARIARETGEYRSRTMHVLRVAFLSGFVLDLAGTFSIAIVAVTVGTRLVVGEFPSRSACSYCSCCPRSSYRSVRSARRSTPRPRDSPPPRTSSRSSRGRIPSPGPPRLTAVRITALRITALRITAFRITAAPGPASSSTGS
ncbi:ABC transporter transmembrane domain-containing protein [Leucobacter soli]|uniref:ABC transporter transmembrane domain-containing protein n=1 Tax=Leucobacter soli TaxID=2812850 RepID=UPI00360EABEE